MRLEETIVMSMSRSEFDAFWTAIPKHNGKYKRLREIAMPFWGKGTYGVYHWGLYSHVKVLVPASERDALNRVLERMQKAAIKAQEAALHA